MSKDSPRTSVLRDNDLIRRGDVRELLQQCDLMGNHPSDPLSVMFNEIPAVQPTVLPDLAALVGALEFYAAWEMEEMEPPTESEIALFDFVLDCPMPKALSDRGEIARAALARVKSKEGFSDEKGVM